MLIFLFLLMLLIIGYVYFGYPLLLYTIIKMRKKRKHVSEAITPSVSLIIAAYNEESVIGQKIENCLSLDYPKEKLEIFVASDCSTDKTNEIVKGFHQQGVRLNVQSKRRGKTSALNDTVPKTGGDIVVFSDANGMYKKDAIKKLVRHFSDPTIGCVCGQLEYYQTEKSLVGGGENLYWRYEVMLKDLESKFNSLVGANGSIYAIRRSLFSRLDEDILDDLATPLTIYSKGYKTIYEPEAVSVEKLSGSLKIEFNKKVRIVLRQLVTFWKLRSLLNMIRGRIGFQILSHKILRTFIPVILVFMLILSMFSSNSLIHIFLFLQIVFYFLAFGGLLLHVYSCKSVLFLIPFYFCIVNAASLVAILYFLRGKRLATWETEGRV